MQKMLYKFQKWQLPSSVLHILSAGAKRWGGRRGLSPHLQGEKIENFALEGVKIS
jgi:hypothetical protein